ncbi:DNA gyrase subunit A [Thalassoroseus pseudoceratinae]|uniref:DNA gyrase subunit A n=1 Tax=Thalassoroseus pseudoceratinae TaxID=2713176 RepID=UPI0014206CE4|nr:DNA gyrase subunit A [Thalassoroseus pseudoceratinae]
MADGNEPPTNDDPNNLPTPSGGRIQQLDIQDEMRDSYLTYAMSVIISRALPDARDGLKPSQRRILVAMNDLNLGPNSGRIKCAKITGDTSGNYHPHGSEGLYPTLVRLAQDWVMRSPLVDKQGNFGSLAGLPPAAQRYTEARLSAVASEMLHDLKRQTVDFVPTYDQRMTEPVVLPSRFPNLLVNGSNGIAVGMATSIPPHNASEVCDGVIMLIDDPEVTVDELMQAIPAPDFPTGGIIMGRFGTRQAYQTGRSTITLRARTHFEVDGRSDVIVVTEIPYLETRDRIREKLEALAKEDRVKGIARVIDLTDRKIPSWQVRLHIVLKKDADKEVVLAQLFQYSPLQVTVSMILLALVGNRPKTLTLKELIQEFLRHRIDVIRRRTEYLLGEARKRKHVVEGLLIAQLDIDHVIQTIRDSSSRAQARERLTEIDVPREMVERALGTEGFRLFSMENDEAANYNLTTRQAEAIVSMQLGSLANLEREELGGEHQKLLEDIKGYLELLSDEANIRAVIRGEMEDLKSKYGEKRRTTISDEELGDVDRDALITEEPMVVTLSQRGYVKRTQLSVYQAQNRGGRGIAGAKSDGDDPIEHLFVASTHDYLLFFTDRGKVYWSKVYDLPLQGRTAKGRALINLLQLDKDERVEQCLAVREFAEDRYLIKVTAGGIVKKTVLSAYSRPLKGGLIAINLDDDDRLIDVRIVGEDDDVLLATSSGMAIRFSQSDARAMGRATRGVKGIKLGKSDVVIGMAIPADDHTLLTVCENGYGKRTPFGPGDVSGDEVDDDAVESDDEGTEEANAYSGNAQYRRQNRGGKGLRDIKTTKRNGPVIDVLSVSEQDEVLMVTAKGKIQRIRAGDISQVGRNTQGVRVIRLEEGDKLVSTARIPYEVAASLADDEAETPVDDATDSVPETSEPTTELDAGDDSRSDDDQEA